MVKNYLVFDDSTIRYYSMAYIDVSNNMALPIFKRNNLKVKIEDVGNKENCRYNIVLCKVRKKDIEKFIESMKELALIIPKYGYGDYEDFCSVICSIAYENIA